MEAVWQLLNSLASSGVKLSVEGNELTCYAQKNALTPELKERMARYKPQIIQILKGGGSDRPAHPEGQAGGAASGYTAPFVDLGAEAVLDPAIQPLEAAPAVDFTSATEVLLTGASGFLGAYLLHTLMTDTPARVHCLIRCKSPDDGRKRIEENLTKYGLWSEDFAARVVAVPGDFTQERLGMDAHAYDSLCTAIDTVFHNGAWVNFVFPYAELKKSNVGGTQEMIRFASRGKAKPLHYVSSAGVVPVPEDRTYRVLESDPLSNWQGLVDGYPQSKWVAEKIVSIAADRGLPVRIYRPGFIAGDSGTGIYNTDDFIPRMLKGCIQLQLSPQTDAMIGMAPVDYVTKAIVHLSCKPQLDSRVFHIVPEYLPVTELTKIVTSLGYRIDIVPYEQWRKALLDDVKTSTENALLPLLPLFTDEPPFQRVPFFDCRQTVAGLKGSGIACPDMDAKLIGKYLDYFRRSGFLSSEAGK